MMKHYIKIFWKTLKRKKLYTFITLIGICFPLIIITLVVAFLSHITVNDTPQSRFDKVVKINHFEVHVKNSRGDDYRLGMNIPYRLYEEYLIKLQVPQMKSFTSLGFADAQTQGKKKNLRIRYADGNFWQIADFNLIEGRFFNNLDVKKMQLFALIDSRSKEFYFGNSSAIGQQIDVIGKRYTIIGVVKSTDVTKTETHADIYIPATTNEGLLKSGYLEGGGTVLVLLKNKNDKKIVEREIKQLTYQIDKRKIDNDCKEIKISTSDDSFFSTIARTIDDLFNLSVRDKTYIVPVSIALLFFFFLLLPSLNLVYINQNRFSERIEEIGIRKSFGCSGITIFKQFVVENFFITFIGGLFSLILSYAVILIINNL